jgi:hypothetical protein
MSQMPYGPNTPAVRRFLVDFAGLSQSDLANVVSRYTQLFESAAWQQAERELGRVIVASGRESAQQALAGPLMQLVRRASPATDGDSSTDAESDQEPEFDDVAEAALAALLTLLAQDLLSLEQRRTLLAPFADVLPAWRVEG